MKKVLIAGFCTTDIISNQTFFGGAAGGIVLNLAKFNLNVGILSVLGNDKFSQKYLEEFKKFKADLSLLIFSKNKISELTVIKDNNLEEGRDFKDFGNFEALANFKPDIKKLNVFDFLHVVNAPRNLCDYLSKNFKGEISYCPGAFLVRDINSLSEKLLLKTNFLFCNEEEFKILEKNFNFKDLFEKKLKLICVTKAKKGLVLLEKEKETNISPVLIKKEKIIDTTGAGDAVVVGFIKSLIKNHTYKQALIEGQKLSAKVIQKYGGQISSS